MKKTGNKNVLMIAYYFPPLVNSGVQRTIKFAKYLPVYNWNPIILTVEENNEIAGIEHASLSNELPKELKVYRTQLLGKRLGFTKQNKEDGPRDFKVKGKTNIGLLKKLKNIAYSLVVPDMKIISWYPFAMLQSKEIFEHNDIDVIYSTSPIATPHLIAMSLAAKYKKPWVADFRDPWTGFFLTKRPFVLRKIEEAMERNVLNKADRIIISWPGIKDKLAAIDENINKKIRVITNGFDEEDFSGIKPKIFNEFTIVYSGISYKKRNPEALFKAVTYLLRTNPEVRKDIKIVIIGNEGLAGDQKPFLNRMIEENGLNDIVELIGYLPHSESLSYILGADVLLLNTTENYVPGKIFEYIRAKKNILALVSENTTVAQIINETKSGKIIRPDKTENIAEEIRKMYEAFKNNSLSLGRENDLIVSKYDRKNLSGQLAGEFNEII